MGLTLRRFCGWPVRTGAVLMCLLCGRLIITPPVQAQYLTEAAGQGIVATGSGRVSLEPRRLELIMRVQAQGTDAKSAAKALMTHKDRVRKDLVEMNADADTIHFTATRFDSGQSDERGQMMTIMRRQMRMEGLTMETVGTTIVTASAGLRVQWVLPKIDAEALAILPHGLMEQVTSRDLAGKNIEPELDEDARESLQQFQETMEENFGGYGFSSSGEGRNQPRIVFVADITDKQRQQAMEQAFAKARGSAELIAKAVGVKLGKLKSVQSQLHYTEQLRMMRFGADEDEMPDQSSEDTLSSATLDGLNLNLSLITVYEIGI
jgi:uncharacterized protein YggE